MVITSSEIRRELLAVKKTLRGENKSARVTGWSLNVEGGEVHLLVQYRIKRETSVRARRWSPNYTR
jgi:hypothetical protein